MKNLLLAGIAALFLATGPAHAQDTANLPTSEEATTGIKKVENTRHVLSDVPTTLWLIFPMNQNCSPIDDRQYEIMKEPEHGIAELEFKLANSFFQKIAHDFIATVKQLPQLR
jgi:hypothetical protein